MRSDYLERNSGVSDLKRKIRHVNADITLTAPDNVFLPNRVPCGPLNASTRSISNKPVLNWRPLAK